MPQRHLGLAWQLTKSPRSSCYWYIQHDALFAELTLAFKSFYRQNKEHVIKSTKSGSLLGKCLLKVRLWHISIQEMIMLMVTVESRWNQRKGGEGAGVEEEECNVQDHSCSFCTQAALDLSESKLIHSLGKIFNFLYLWFL